MYLYSTLKNIKKNWPKKLPKGIIHGDLFIDNIFFNKNKLSGIIDFYFAANDYFMYEIAICINALCFDNKKSKFKKIYNTSQKIADVKDNVVILSDGWYDLEKSLTSSFRWSSVNTNIICMGININKINCRTTIQSTIGAGNKSIR